MKYAKTRLLTQLLLLTHELSAVGGFYLLDFEKVCDFNNLYNAYLDSRKGKGWKNSTALYQQDALYNTWLIREELVKGWYELGEYNVFSIYSPKPRIIKSISFKDKVVQRSLCDNVLTPAFEKHFIHDNYACRKGKGVHAGIDRTKEYLRAHYRKYGLEGYVLKCDIEKYFDSIDHEILKGIVRKLVKDDRVFNLLVMIIDSITGSGLPLGNQTSQLFSLVFLSAFDHYVKETLRIKHYIRYMDDFVLIDPDKEYLQYCKKEIEFLLADLKLELNQKSHIFPIKNGFDFLGFYIYLTNTGKVIMKLRRESKERMRRKLKKFKELYREGKITKEQIDQAWNSWTGHAQHGNCYYLIKHMRTYYDAIFI